MTNLTDWLLNDQGKKHPTSFNQTFNTPLKYYEWIEQPGNEHRVVRFGHAMHGSQQFEITENIITCTYLPLNSLCRIAALLPRNPLYYCTITLPSGSR